MSDISSSWSTQEHPFWMDNNVPAPTMRYTPASLSLTLTESYHDGKRWYRHDGQFYPSITTLLSATDEEGNKALAKWRSRVGHAEATRITTTAASAGTRWHNFCEAYLTGGVYWNHLANPQDRPMAAAIGRLLNTKIKNVILSESRIVSTKYGIAGRMDICAELMDGRLAVIDFKTGKKPKTGNRLTNYGIQAAFYAEALTEWLQRGILDTVVIVQLCPMMLLWQESSASVWIPQLEERVSKFATYVNEQLT